MTRACSFVVVVSIALVGLAPSRIASAQTRRATTEAPSKPSADAVRLKTAADVLMDQDRYADALALYEKAYDLSQDPALLYNQGRALEAMGEYPTALEKLEAFDQRAPAALRARVPGLGELIASLRSRIGTLVVRTNAPNARLLVRDKAEGTIHRELRVRVRAGAATVEVSAEGYEPKRIDVELAPGAELAVDATLAPKKKDPVLVVRVAPPADVHLDGSAMGRSPLELRVSPGVHELLARAEGYEDERVAMTLAMGERRDVVLDLKRTPGVTSRWWFWTGIGVIVLGGAAAATAVALTTERDPQRGSIATVPGP